MQRCPPLLAAAVLLLPTAAAIPIGDLPVLDRVVTDDGGYVAWRVFVPAGATVGFVLKSKAVDAERLMLGTWHSTPESEDLQHGGQAGFPFATVRSKAVILESPVLGTVHSEHSVEGSAGAWAAGSLRETATEDREWTFLLVAAVVGNARTTFEMNGGEGVEVVARTTGPSFFLTDVADFQGGTRVMVRDPAGRVDYPAFLGPTLGISEGVTHVQGARAGLSVHDSLFGSFRGFTNTGELHMSYDAPGQGHVSVRNDCVAALLNPCSMSVPFQGAAAGDYLFNIDAQTDFFTTAPVCWFDVRCLVPPTVFAWGADVRLP